MISFKTVVFQLAILAAVVAAQRAGHKMPSITRATFVPQAPILPDEFTAALSERIMTSDNEDYVVEGFYYYSNALQAVQIDFTAPGYFGTELMMNGVMTVGTFTAGSITCFNTTSVIPFLPPDILQTFQFLGVSVSPTGEMLYAWGEELSPDYSLVVFTDAQTGALVYEFTEDFSLQYSSFSEGVPDTVFQESCGAAQSGSSQVKNVIHPRGFLLGHV